jgi:hypothetical protein
VNGAVSFAAHYFAKRYEKNLPAFLIDPASIGSLGKCTAELSGK